MGFVNSTPGAAAQREGSSESEVLPREAPAAAAANPLPSLPAHQGPEAQMEVEVWTRGPPLNRRESQLSERSAPGAAPEPGFPWHLGLGQIHYLAENTAPKVWGGKPCLHQHQVPRQPPPRSSAGFLQGGWDVMLRLTGPPKPAPAGDGAGPGQHVAPWVSHSELTPDASLALVPSLCTDPREVHLKAPKSASVLSRLKREPVPTPPTLPTAWLLLK
ncbi:PREDICTED: uncharacterized protein LOC108520723 [Rhinopithecus bieti]|uniref:uncharacterized protein LOC108520723 n=1 Tax=Rhinopithecus bieti TaxID=61621 RepID=UPI00083C20E7|nr:PREDICTED: uncharacterized protein LOC108520723 [Rhinopithecus bieti]